MLGSLKRLFSPSAPSAAPGPDLGAVLEWAQRAGRGFKRARDGQGFVVDGRLDARPWRMEWGPSQRDYIIGHELRLRMELDLRSDMQMLLLGRNLMATLERQTYEQFTESTQTQIGNSTPEEMRWLVMFPQVDLSTLPAVRSHFAAVASTPAAGLAWLQGPLAQALERARATLLAGDPPFVLMILRNRAYLRVQMAQPQVDAVAMALDLFETAVAQAQRSADSHVDSTPEWNTTASSAWQSLKPDDAARRR